MFGNRRHFRELLTPSEVPLLAHPDGKVLKAPLLARATSQNLRQARYGEMSRRSPVRAKADLTLHTPGVVVGEARADVVGEADVRTALGTGATQDIDNALRWHARLRANQRTARGTQESLRNSAYSPGFAEIVAPSATIRDGSFRGRCAVSDDVACQPSFAASPLRRAISVWPGESLGDGCTTHPRRTQEGWLANRSSLMDAGERRLVDQTSRVGTA
jgi:hypothetical protein